MKKVWIIVALAAAAGPAHADHRSADVPQKARDLAERGRAFHDAGDYVDAIAAFREAYVLAPSPGLLFNLAQAYRLAGQCDDAAWMYRRYLASDPPAAQRGLAQAHLLAVEKCGHGGLRVALAPVPPPSEVTVAQRYQPTPLTRAPQPAPMPAGEREQRIGLGLAIAGGVVLAGAAYFAFDAYQASSTVSHAYVNGAKWADIAPIDARGATSASTADALALVGGAAVVSGAVVYVIGRRAETSHHVAVAPTRGGAAMQLSWGF